MIRLGVNDSFFESIISWANLYQRPVTVSGLGRKRTPKDRTLSWGAGLEVMRSPVQVLAGIER
jgi:hypothetical protein